MPRTRQEYAEEFAQILAGQLTEWARRPPESMARPVPVDGIPTAFRITGLGDGPGDGPVLLVQITADPDEPLPAPAGLAGMTGSPTRQDQLDRAYLDAQAAVQRAAELQAEQGRAQLEFIAAGRALIDEQAEVAKLQREDLAGATWRQAVAIAGERVLGSALIGANAEDVRKAIRDEAEWFAHELASPPVVF